MKRALFIFHDELFLIVVPYVRCIQDHLIIGTILATFLMTARRTLIYSMRWVLIYYYDRRGRSLFIALLEEDAYLLYSETDAYFSYTVRRIPVPRSANYVVPSSSLEEVDHVSFTYTYMLHGAGSLIASLCSLPSR